MVASFPGRTPHALCSFTFFRGSERTGWPVAAKMAFMTAGDATEMVGSPMPPQKPPEGMTRVTTLGNSASRTRDLVHEALEIDRVLVGVDAAPGADRHVRVAHGVLDEQVRQRVAELLVAGHRGVALQLPVVLAVGHRGRIDEGVDRLAGD